MSSNETEAKIRFYDHVIAIDWRKAARQNKGS